MKITQKISGILVLALVVVLAASCGGPDEKKMKYYDRGKEFYDKGDFVKATLELKNALQIDGKFAEAYYLLGMCELKDTKKGNPKKAYGLFAKAVELNPDLLDAQAAMGQLLLLGRQPDKAKEKADFILTKSPKHKDALLLRAALTVSEKKESEAEGMLRSIIQQYPDSADAYLMLARIRVNENKLDEAVQVLKDLLSRDKANKNGLLLLAQIYEKQKNLAEAEEQYKALIAAEPGTDTFKILLAGFYERTGSGDKTIKVFTDLIASKPDEEKYRVNLAKYFAEKKQAEKMVEVLNQAIKDLPDKFAAPEMLSQYYVSEKKQDNALEILNTFMTRVNTGPLNIRAKGLKAKILASQEKLDQALALAEEVIRENPADVVSHTLKGDISLFRKDFNGAITEYRTVLAQDSANTTAVLKLAQAHLANKQNELAEDVIGSFLKKKPEDVTVRWGLIDLYRRRGKLDLMETQLREILKHQPQDPRALNVLGDLSMSRKDAQAASQFYQQFMQAAPNSAEAYYKYGLAQQALKKDAEAVKYFEQALTEDANYSPALDQIVAMQMRDNKPAEAIKRIQAQIAKQPKNHFFYLTLGRIQANIKQFDEARKSLEDALDIEPNSQDAVFWLARLELAQGSVEKAIERVNESRKEHPDNIRFDLLAATLLELNQQPAKAKDIYAKVLERDPNIWSAANNLAFYYAEYEPTADNLAKAKKLIDPVVSRLPESVEVVDTAAWVYYRLGDYDKALETIAPMIVKGAELPAFNFHLGMIYIKTGDPDKAKQYLKLALDANKPFPGRDVAEKELKKL